MTIRVVLADDHAVVREGLKLILETQADIAVVGSAANGRDAVTLAKVLHPDVVVMDIAMPELNGIEALQRIRADLPATQVVVLSMHATAEHVYRALQAGALAYVVKEGAGKELVAAVHTVHKGRRYLSEKVGGAFMDDYIRRREASGEEGPLALLSARERQILQLVVEGKSSADIAEIVHLSRKTVETYRSRLMQKLDIRNVPGLVRFALEHGLTR